MGGSGGTLLPGRQAKERPPGCSPREAMLSVKALRESPPGPSTRSSSTRSSACASRPSAPFRGTSRRRCEKPGLRGVVPLRCPEKDSGRTPWRGCSPALPSTFAAARSGRAAEFSDDSRSQP